MRTSQEIKKNEKSLDSEVAKTFKKGKTSIAVDSSVTFFFFTCTVLMHGQSWCPCLRKLKAFPLYSLPSPVEIMKGLARDLRAATV